MVVRNDFTSWKNHDSWQSAFNRLVNELKAEAHAVGAGEDFFRLAQGKLMMMTAEWGLTAARPAQSAPRSE